MSTSSHKRENGILAFMLVAISVAFGWILWPFAGAILWAVLLSIIFAPWYQGTAEVDAAHGATLHPARLCC